MREFSNSAAPLSRETRCRWWLRFLQAKGKVSRLQLFGRLTSATFSCMQQESACDEAQLCQRCCDRRIGVSGQFGCGGPDRGGERFTAIGPSGVSPTTITWLFPTDIVGFFADFESATFAQFEVLDSSDNVLGTVKISDFIPPPQFGSSNGPLGVVDLATPFNQIRWSAIPGVNFELFGVNSFQYTDGTPAPDIIPLPAPALMLVSGIVALGALRIRRITATGS